MTVGVCVFVFCVRFFFTQKLYILNISKGEKEEQNKAHNLAIAIRAHLVLQYKKNHFWQVMNTNTF